MSSAGSRRPITHLVVWLAPATLVYGSVLVFLAFDRASHSASDTLRPFVLTMGPVWALAAGSARLLLRRRS